MPCLIYHFEKTKINKAVLLNINPEFSAVILAATPGSRLYPLTITGRDEFEKDVNFGHDDDDDDNGKVVANNANDDEDDDDDFKRSIESNEQQQQYSSSAPPVTKRKEEEKEVVTSYLPKHLLPLAGRPLIHHLIDKLIHAGMQHIIIAISSEDEVTIPSLVEMSMSTSASSKSSSSSSSSSSTHGNKSTKGSNVVKKHQSLDMISCGNIVLKVVQLPSDCSGSADALRFIASVQLPPNDNHHQINPTETNDDHDDNHHNDDDDEDTTNNRSKNSIIPSNSHVMVMTADLIPFGDLCTFHENNKENIKNTNNVLDTFGTLADVHRQNYRLGTIGEGLPLAMTLLLSDVGEMDENGLPLKESAKVRK